MTAPWFSRYRHVLAAIVIVLVVLFVWRTFPPLDDYRFNADEGAYYRQGNVLVDEGFAAGFRKLGNDFVAQAQRHQELPSPLRPGVIAAAALALEIDDSYVALSWVSLLAFVVLLVAFWRFATARWSFAPAFIALCLVAMSPLALGMARRALMDSLTYAVSALSLFAFFRLVERPSRRSLAIFVLAVTVALTVKETSLFLLAFYSCALLIMRWGGYIGLRLHTILFASAAPLLLCVLCYGVAFGFHALPSMASVEREWFDIKIPYGIDYSQGPWNRYLVDFLVLSPSVLLLALLYVGYRMRAEIDRSTAILLALGIYLIAIYAFPTKSARYLLMFDLVIRCFAALMIFAMAQVLRGVAQRRLTRFGAVLFPTVAVLLLAVSNLAAYQRYFGSNAVYDTVTYNLMRVDKMLPPVAPAITQSKDRLTALRDLARNQPTADNFVNLAQEYCGSGLPWECAWASEQAIRLAADNATAYNNLCAADNDLRDWQGSIAACSKALELKPDFELARRNLDWAQQSAGR